MTEPAAHPLPAARAGGGRKVNPLPTDPRDRCLGAHADETQKPGGLTVLFPISSPPGLTPAPGPFGGQPPA